MECGDHCPHSSNPHPKGSQHFGPVQNFAKDAGEIG
jgi:hypothetical protein